MYRYKDKTVEQYRREYYKRIPIEWRMYNSAKARAKSKGLPFDLEKHDIIIPAICPYLGIPIISSEKKVTANSPSLDRIKTELGYVKGNVEVISHMANRMKQDVSPEMLLYFSRKVIEKFT